MNIMIYSSYWC